MPQGQVEGYMNLHYVACMTMSYNQKVAFFCTQKPEWQLVDYQQNVHYKKNVLNSVVCIPTNQWKPQY